MNSKPDQHEGACCREFAVRSAASAHLERSCQSPISRPRPRAGFYIMRLRRGVSLMPTLICQHCMIVLPQPSAVNGPNPQDSCRHLDGSPRLDALIDGTPAAVDRRSGLYIALPAAG